MINLNDYEYSVIVENEIIASGMTLDNALVLVKALFQERYNESTLKISIQRDLLERCTVLDEAVAYE